MATGKMHVLRFCDDELVLLVLLVLLVQRVLLVRDFLENFIKRLLREFIERLLREFH